MWMWQSVMIIAFSEIPNPADLAGERTLPVSKQQMAIRKIDHPEPVHPVGFHQSGLWITTRPLRVPNFGPSVLVRWFGTKSTTGTPRRQMVTTSPLSTTRINQLRSFRAAFRSTFMLVNDTIADSFFTSQRYGLSLFAGYFRNNPLRPLR
jgi:hypothetical protein